MGMSSLDCWREAVFVVMIWFGFVGFSSISRGGPGEFKIGGVIGDMF